MATRTFQAIALLPFKPNGDPVAQFEARVSSANARPGPTLQER